MSRQKSNRTLLLEQECALRKAERQLKREAKERDTAIRKERRERKRQECEAKRTIRARKRETHEHVVQNGIPKVQSGGEKLGLRDAMTYSPLVLCGGCGDAIRETILIGDLCPKCKYGEEVVDSPDVLKAKQGDALTGVHHGPLEAQDERRRA